MSLVILTQGEVIEKSVRDYTRSDGTVTQYYNIRIGDRNLCDSQGITVPQDLFNAVKEGDHVQLKGVAGGIGRDKWWDFKELVGKKDKEK